MFECWGLEGVKYIWWLNVKHIYLCSKQLYIMPKANKFDKVEALPTGATTLSNYAKNKGYSVQYIYKLIALNRATFKIVNFQGINFVFE